MGWDRQSVQKGTWSHDLAEQETQGPKLGEDLSNPGKGEGEKPGPGPREGKRNGAATLGPWEWSTLIRPLTKGRGLVPTAGSGQG